MRIFVHTILFACAGLLPVLTVSAQMPSDTTKGGPVRSSAAYAELLLRRTELESSLESLLVDYTEDFPKIKEIRLELGFLKSEMDRLMVVKPAEAGKLTSALGKLMLRKVELEAELETLRLQYNDNYPDVKRAKRKVEVFENAIKEILG